MKLLRKLAIVTCSAFVVMNIVAYIHAYRVTHFSDSSVARTKDPTQLTAFDKVKVLFMGVDNPRPQHRSTPDTPFDTFFISSSGELECWRINTPDAIGTMIMFHGYAGEKSSLLERAEKFRAMGFNTVLVDFTGSGGSEGNSTTVGFDEARQVKDCYEAISKTDHQIFLFGTSMGAAAILKAMDDYQLPTKACVLECPFGSLSETVNARFKMMHVPNFPMATLLTFWVCSAWLLGIWS